MVIIGITGSLGAGKGAVVEHLVSRGFKDYSARGFITEEIERRGLHPDRATLTETANGLRRAHGADFIIKSLYERAKEAGGDAVIESIRNPSEIEHLKNAADFHLIAVDADQRLRYERIRERKHATDHVTFEQFAADEAREATSTDPAAQHVNACIAVADFVISNNGTREELDAEVERVVSAIRASQK